MPQITLNREQVRQITDIAQRNGLQDFFVAKDEGAYVGITGGQNGKFERAIFYFRGCNPDKDPDFYEQALVMFGGDDFGVHLSVKPLKGWLADGLKKLTIKVAPESVRMTARIGV